MCDNFRKQYGWVNSHTIRIDMFNNEYYKILLGEPVRYQDGECVAKGWTAGAGDCEDFDPVTTTGFDAWAHARARSGWTNNVLNKWNTSFEEPGPFTFKNYYMIKERCTKTKDCNCRFCNLNSGFR